MKSTLLLSKGARKYLPVLAGLVCVANLFGQASDGNVTGSVTDPTGAAIRGVKIEFVNKATGVKYETSTETAGSYRLGNVPVGNYTGTASVSGFNTNQIENIVVGLSRTATVDFAMTVATQAQTVEVSESVVAIDTATSQISNAYQTRTALELTMASSGESGALNLSLLSAGISSGGGVGYGTGPSIGGQRPTNNNFQIEGMDNNRRDVTGPIVNISNEAVAEFSISQNLFSAEFGHSSGGQFNTVLKTGTNEIHGSAYNYFQNKNLNAVDVAVKRQGITERTRYDKNRFGGSVGGPIIKNRWFYFGNLEREVLGQAGTPQAAAFSPTAAGYATLQNITGIRRQNLDILRQYLAPAGTSNGNITVGGRSIPVGILENIGPSYRNTTNVFASTDFDVTSSDRLRYRYVMNKIDQINTNAQLPAFYANRPIRQYLTQLSYFKTISPSITNEARFGYTRYNDTIPVGDFQFPGLDSFPNIIIDDLNQVNIGPDPNSPQSTIINTYQLTDNLSWITNRSAWKFGYDGRKLIAPQFFIQRVRGDYNYSTLDQFLFDRSPDFGERSRGASPWAGDLFSHYLYANNDYKLKPNMTLNLGLRYEWIDVPAGDKQQRLNSIASVPGLIEFRAPKAQKNGFTPRLGLAWSPGRNGNTSVRAGFSMNYDQIYQNLGILSLPPQFFSTVNVNTPDTPNFLAQGGLAGGASTGTLSASAARAATSSFVPDQQRPYSLNWTLGIQRRLGNDYTFEARYVGTKGVHLPVQNRLNRAPLVTPDRSLPTFLQRPTQAALDALTLTLPQLQAGVSNTFASAGFANNVVGFMPWGNSSYHGLALQMNKRFSRNTMFVGSYTWSHAIDDSTAAVFSTVVAPRRVQDFRNQSAEKSSSVLDRRHRFTFTMAYDFMPFQGSSWFLKNIAGNWNLNGTYMVESPILATVQSGVDANLNGDNAGDRAVINPAGDARVGSAATALRNTAGAIVGYLATNPNARYIQAQAGTYANGGRSTLSLRGINNVDFSALKNFNLNERMKLQFRAELSNIFNHAQFLPGFPSDVRPPLFLTGTRSFLLPQDANFGNPEVAYGSNPRIAQLALRFVF